MNKVVLSRVSMAIAVAIPAAVVRSGGIYLPPVAAAAVFGAAVTASAFLLMWASEAARKDISGGLALALLAFIAVLPEYAVDLYFAYAAGHRPAYTAFAAANMTGANRLLVGFGWPLILAAFLFGSHGRGERRLTLASHRRVSVAFLAVAGVYAFVIPLTRQIAWYDSLVLFALFGAYLWRISRTGEEDKEELVGVAEAVAELPATKRRVAVVMLFVVAGAIIATSAEPFADALVVGGRGLGIDEFLLVQWLAPLASETPEFLVALLLARRGRGDDAMGVMLASKVNQWTLLVGSLPLAFWMGGGGPALPLDARQVEEFLLTATQTMVGIAVLADLRFWRWEAAALFGLFALQFAFPGQHARVLLCVAYSAVALVLFVRKRAALEPLGRALVGREAHRDHGERAPAERP